MLNNQFLAAIIEEPKHSVVRHTLKVKKPTRYKLKVKKETLEVKPMRHQLKVKPPTLVERVAHLTEIDLPYLDPLTGKGEIFEFECDVARFLGFSRERLDRMTHGWRAEGNTTREKYNCERKLRLRLYSFMLYVHGKEIPEHVIDWTVNRWNSTNKKMKRYCKINSSKKDGNIVAAFEELKIAIAYTFHFMANGNLETYYKGINRLIEYPSLKPYGYFDKVRLVELLLDMPRGMAMRELFTLDDVYFKSLRIQNKPRDPKLLNGVKKAIEIWTEVYYYNNPEKGERMAQENMGYFFDFLRDRLKDISEHNPNMCGFKMIVPTRKDGYEYPEIIRDYFLYLKEMNYYRFRDIGQDYLWKSFVVDRMRYDEGYTDFWRPLFK